MSLSIVAVSFEERSRALVEGLPEGMEDEHVLVLDFLGYENIGPYLYNRTKILKNLVQSGVKQSRVEVDLARPLEAMKQLTVAIDRIGPVTVTLDVSVLPKTFLFGLCRLLLSLGIPTVIRYYKPARYGATLSRGIGRVSCISGFEGEMRTSGEIFLAIVLGFEGYKALHAWECIGPSKCFALVGTPPYREEFLAQSLESNKEFLKTVEGIELRDLHTYDVRAAIVQLDEVLEESRTSSPDSSFILCPLGTKLQSLACFGLAYSNPEVTVANVSSLTYYPGDYSRGFDPEYTEITLEDVVVG